MAGEPKKIVESLLATLVEGIRVCLKESVECLLLRVQLLEEIEVKPCTRTEQGDNDGHRWENVESDLGMHTKSSATPIFQNVARITSFPPV